MPVLPPKKGSTNRRPSMRGSAIIDIVRGVERVRAWPRKRGKSKFEHQRKQQEYFRQAQWAAKYQDARITENITEMVKGTPLMPRDLMLMLWSGRAYAFVWDNKKVWWPMPAMQDVSLSLDVITDVVGNTLIRGEQYWEGIPFGGGGGGGSVLAIAYTGNQTASGSANASKGAILDPIVDITTSAITVMYNAVVGGQYQVSIWEVDATNHLVTQLAASTIVTEAAAVRVERAFNIITALAAGKRYAAIFTRTNGANNYALPLFVSTGTLVIPWSGLPFRAAGIFLLPQNTPAIGQTLTVVVGQVAIGVLGGLT